MRLVLQRVKYIPRELEPGVLYFAEEFGASAHLCPCGCDSKVRTPIGPTEWTLTEGRAGVSLTPSVGNWQHPCKSHYWIEEGEIVWSAALTEKQILAGRTREHARREAYFAARPGLVRRFIAWIVRPFSHKDSRN